MIRKYYFTIHTPPYAPRVDIFVIHEHPKKSYKCARLLADAFEFTQVDIEGNQRIV